jgi:hypothetical protein
MTTSARWDTGVFDDSRWDTLVEQVSGSITDGPDSASGSVAQVISLSAAITEGADNALGIVNNIITVTGAINENPDTAIGIVLMPIPTSGNITENPDVVYSVVQVKYAYRGGWAPQFNYKREWEQQPEVVIEQGVVLEVAEPEFIPTPQPIDPAVARMIQAMMYRPTPIDTEEDDIEAVLMNL